MRGITGHKIARENKKLGRDGFTRSHHARMSPTGQFRNKRAPQAAGRACSTQGHGIQNGLFASHSASPRDMPISFSCRSSSWQTYTRERRRRWNSRSRPRPDAPPARRPASQLATRPGPARRASATREPSGTRSTLICAILPSITNGRHIKTPLLTALWQE